ncbi:MAG TPA: hypothetical protein VH253_18050 [Phycisphaerae bacterium]|nr:hypothetical protein [Phycisphaerae bacterium]
MTQTNGNHVGLAEIERQARLLAKENRQAEPAITKVYWFPDEHEVRLVEVDTTMPPSGDGLVHPFFFRPSPQDDLPSPSGVALISPEEDRRAELPEGWGSWEDARELESEG